MTAPQPAERTERIIDRSNESGFTRHEAAAETERRFLDESALAARELKAAGVTLRDIGDIIGVSFQRAGRLVAG